MTSKIRTRFAPSPTGFIHLGNIRSALYPWAFARANGGDFILRIEDTDLLRSKQEYTDSILASMRWLGLDWDGELTYQTQRADVYNRYVDKLLENGLLEKDDKGYLTPGSRARGIPMVGEVAAGFPSPAEEELRDIISFDEYLVTKPESSFLLQVSGDSMIGEGIREGDLVIVEKGREPKNGDIVVAQVDGEWTMKYFRKQGKQVRLEAANPNYPPIIPKAELLMGGVVTAVIRKYHL